MKKSVVIFAFFIALLTASNYFCDISVIAQKEYGYKAGDEYLFIVEMSSTADTEEGKTTTTSSYEMLVRIQDVDEDADGYSIKIDVIIVCSGRGYFPGQPMGYWGPIIQKQTLEGDTLITNGGFWPTTLFTTTDWDKRGDEWDEYVEQINRYEGCTVTDSYASGGVFTVSGEIDVSDDDSYIDYDDDGDYDGYTGTFAIRSEYDKNGVLVSSSIQMEITFNYRNRMTSTYKIYRGPKPLIPGGTGTLTYILIGGISVAACIITFFLGVYTTKRRKPTVPTIPLIDEKERLKSLMENLDRQLMEGKISEETYRILKNKYERMLEEKA